MKISSFNRSHIFRQGSYSFLNLSRSHLISYIINHTSLKHILSKSIHIRLLFCAFAIIISFIWK
nr:MAG TPA: hypothetical protein [Caudoviricetes sp.]